MTVHQESIQASRSIRGDVPQPVSLETIAVVEQMLTDMLRGLREKATSQPAAADAGAIEYESWLRGARH
jgi:hypothetical protein